MNRKSWMKHHCLKKENFIATYICRVHVYKKRDYEDFEAKDSGEYHDLYIKSDTFPLTDVFENFKKMCLKFYRLDPSKFFQLQD